MIGQFLQRLHRYERSINRSFGNDISTPRTRRLALWHFHLFDHAFLRVAWTNMFEIAPDVWRSNQPSPGRLKRYRDMGITTVLNLRGETGRSAYLFEQEACAKLGLKLLDIKLTARALVPRERLLRLLDMFETIETPFVMHCKSGADRAGLASALYLLHIEGAPLSVAKKQLGLKYAHLRSSDTGILDHLLDTYEADTAEAPMPIREWIETRYDPAALTASFNDHRGRG